MVLHWEFGRAYANVVSACRVRMAVLQRFVGATVCLSAALRARKQLGAPSLLRVESTVCFQRKRGLPASIKTQAGQVRVAILYKLGCG